MENIAIIGSGGFAREVLSLLQSINQINPKYNILGFIDNEHPVGTIINGYHVMGTDDEINASQSDRLSLVIAVGDPKIKQKIRSKFDNKNITFPSIIHPSTIIQDEQTIQIGEGCIICAGCILTVNIILENFITLNLMTSVGHDTRIMSYSSVMPGVNISGEVLIKERVYIGTGAKIINQVEIGENSIIGAGAVVTKNIPANSTAVGIPAKCIK